jgi:hypothetical protein
MPRALKPQFLRNAAASERRFTAKALGLPAYLVLLPGRLVAHHTGLPEGSDHEQILRMFANTAFWTLVGVVAVIVVV